MITRAETTAPPHGWTLSDLCTVTRDPVCAPVMGEDRGVCCVCGRESDCGWRREPSEAFNAWHLVSGGSFFCPHCWGMLKHRPCRFSSWTLDRDGLRTYSSSQLSELASYLQRPNLPCAVYLTESRRKQAWVALGRRVSVHPCRIWVATDWVGPVLVDGMDTRYLELATGLLERGVRRATLRSGVATPREWQQAIAGGWQGELERALALAGDPVWQVWAFLARPKEADAADETGEADDGK